MQILIIENHKAIQAPFGALKEVLLQAKGTTPALFRDRHPPPAFLSGPRVCAFLSLSHSTCYN